MQTSEITIFGLAGWQKEKKQRRWLMTLATCE